MSLGTVADRERLQQEVTVLERRLDAGAGTDRAEFVQERNVDRGVLERRLKERKGTLVKITPLKLSDKERDNLNSRRKVLEDKISPDMQSRDVMMGRKSSTGRAPFSGAAMSEVKFQEQHGTEVRELKDICRKLEPDDPTFANIERLRVQRRASDPRDR